MEDKWDPDLIGFFYPDMPSSLGTDEIVIVNNGNTSFFRTAYSFVRMLRRSTQYSWNIHRKIEYEEALCKNLPSCLKGEAQSWWLNLDPIKQLVLTRYNDLEKWCQLLLQDFKLSPDEALIAFNNVRYTSRDALDNRRHPHKYTGLLELSAEQCGIPPTELAHWAWQHLDHPLRRLIPRPRKGVTLGGFGNILLDNVKREFWDTKPRLHYPRNDKSVTQKLPSDNPRQTLTIPSSATSQCRVKPAIAPVNSLTSLPLTSPGASPDTLSETLSETSSETSLDISSVSSSTSVSSPPAIASTSTSSVTPSTTVSSASSATTTSVVPASSQPQPIYSSTRKLTIRPRSSVQIPVRNRPKGNCAFSPLLPLLSQCGCSLKSEWLRVFNYSTKPITIDRRARLGSVKLHAVPFHPP